MAERYFADTFYWIALNYPQDIWHVRVATWANAHQTAQLVTTEEVLSEFLTWFSRSGPAGRANAAATALDIMHDPSVQVLPQTSADFHAAINFYKSRLDKNYSLTDCRSMSAMKSLALHDVLSNDHHFSQEGFTVLFRSSS